MDRSSSVNGPRFACQRERFPRPSLLSLSLPLPLVPAWTREPRNVVPQIPPALKAAAQAWSAGKGLPFVVLTPRRPYLPNQPLLRRMMCLTWRRRMVKVLSALQAQATRELASTYQSATEPSSHGLQEIPNRIASCIPRELNVVSKSR